MRFVAAIAACLLLSNCAFIEDQVTIRYNAPANISVAKGAENVTVQVVAQDGRVSNRDRVATKKNGYGMEMAKITAANDVVREVGDGVRVELASLGFKIGPGGLIVNVETAQFYNDFKPGFFAADSVAEVAFNLTAKRQDGSFVYSKSYKAVGATNGNVLMGGDAAAKPLTDALREAVQQVARDSDLHQALVKAGSAPAGRPVS
jgi:uncharacterized lipoprotein